jgi:hypothetical protein
MPNTTRGNMSCYRKGEKVVWVSPYSGDRSLAFFLDHDHDFPKRYVILAIGIGRKGHKMRHSFRWPLRFVQKLNVS